MQERSCEVERKWKSDTSSVAELYRGLWDFLAARVEARQCTNYIVSLWGSPQRFSNPAVPKLYQNQPMSDFSDRSTLTIF
jgi:hypothetical protein